MTEHTAGRPAVKELIRLLHRTSEGITRRAQEMAERSGSHPTDLTAVSLLARHAGQPLTVSALGEQLNLSRAATTSLVDRLERVGHVRRVRDETDRRRIYLHTTEAADAAAEAVLKNFLDRTVAALEGYSDAELAAARRFLTDVCAALEQSSPRGELSAGGPCR